MDYSNYYFRTSLGDFFTIFATSEYHSTQSIFRSHINIRDFTLVVLTQEEYDAMLGSRIGKGYSLDMNGWRASDKVWPSPYLQMSGKEVQ